MVQYTLNDLTLRVIQDLNLVDSEQIPAAADFAYVKQVIEQEFAYLVADGVIFQGTTLDSISPEYMNPLADYMGGSIGPTFGAMNAGDANQVQEFALAKIRKLSVPSKTPEMLNIERAARGARIRDPIVSQG